MKKGQLFEHHRVRLEGALNEVETLQKFLVSLDFWLGYKPQMFHNALQRIKNGLRTVLKETANDND